jgi:hypothetical protein
MSGSPSTRKSDHLYWIRYPDGDPWFIAEWKTEGNLLLSTSYSNHRFLRNFADMFDQGLRIAGDLNARLFEEVNEREITSRNIDSLLSPSDNYVQLQAGTWKQAIEQLSTKANAPLEYPLGPIDLVSEYLVFHITPLNQISDDSVSGMLLKGAKVVAAGGGAWCAVEAESEKWLTKVLRRPDGKWQVWPAWGQSPFSRIAETTVAAVDQLHQAAHGDIQFLGRPYNDSLRAGVRSRIAGLGVDFHAWTQTLKAQS